VAILLRIRRNHLLSFFFRHISCNHAKRKRLVAEPFPDYLLAKSIHSEPRVTLDNPLMLGANLGRLYRGIRLSASLVDSSISDHRGCSCRGLSIYDCAFLGVGILNDVKLMIGQRCLRAHASAPQIKRFFIHSLLVRIART
jgi:hypothetical protein